MGCSRNFRSLLDANPSQITIANRSLEKARALQHVFKQTNYCSFEELAEGYYDLIINATSASLDNQTLAIPESLMKHRPFVTIWLIANKVKQLL